MARPEKIGLEYFPLDVDIDQDDKVQLIEAKFGITGFGIIIKLFMKIYKEGYYYNWTEKEQLLFSKRVNVDINLLNDIVNECLKWDLFDINMYKKYGILTSKGIQRRYFEAVSRRQSVITVREYCLIDTKEYSNIVYVDNNSINVDINPASIVVNDDIGTQSKVKKSKVKESKEEKIKYAEYVSMTNDEYQKLLIAYGEENTKRMIEVLDNYKGATGKKYKSDYRAILNWVVDRVMKEEKKYAINVGNTEQSLRQSNKLSGQEKREDKLFSRGLD